MEGADGLPVLDPAATHRAVRVRATTEHCVKLAPVIENREPKPVDVDGNSPAFHHFDGLANLHETGHAITLKGHGDAIGNEKPRTCVGA